MNELLLNAQCARFGQSSEKQTYVMQNGRQLGLFNEAEAAQNPKEPEPTEETLVKTHTRKPKRTIDELTEGLPVEKVLLDLPEEEQICDACGTPLRCWNYTRPLTPAQPARRRRGMHTYLSIKPRRR